MIVMEVLRKKVRATVPALIYALGFMVVLILSAAFSDEIRTIPIIGMVITTALVVFYILAIYFLFNTVILGLQILKVGIIVENTLSLKMSQPQ